MTREEAIRKLEYSKKAYQRLIDEKVDSGKLVGKDVKGEWKADTPLDEAYKSMIDALEIAIKALEQYPCEDAISRQSAIFLASDLKQDLPDDERISDMVMAHNEGILEYQTQLSLLPSVTPQPKVGEWLKNGELCKCSRCGSNVLFSAVKLYNYCFRCGARMKDFNQALSKHKASFNQDEPTCSECIIKDTDACSRGNTEADEVACEDFVGGESDV